jgi:Spy/CpxP family protein refolding chaperone
MNARKTIAIVVLTIGIIPLSVASWGAENTPDQNGPAGFGMPGIGRLISGNIGRLLVLKSELNITPAQRHQIASAVKSHRQEIAPVAKAVLEKKRALRDVVLLKPGDEKAIRKASEELGKAIGDAAVVASKVVDQAKGALTQEQQERIHLFRASCKKAETDWVESIGQ